MAVTQRDGQLPHIKWLDLKGNGVMVECAILKEDPQRNLYFIEVPSLDKFDKQRLVKIITNRNAKSFELWDLMSQVTLNNGVNALSYFHQLVKIITPSGVIMNPRGGTVGTERRQPYIDPKTEQQNAFAPEASVVATPPPAKAPVKKSAPAAK